MGGPLPPTNMQLAQAHYELDKLEETDNGGIIFSSPGGTGKTWTIASIVAILSMRGREETKVHIICPNEYLL